MNIRRVNHRRCELHRKENKRLLDRRAQLKKAIANATQAEDYRAVEAFEAALAGIELEILSGRSVDADILAECGQEHIKEGSITWLIS